ncbi:MAG: DUF1924 domain-containing protein [Betaproteobacteria bacterium]|nr:DUF1924 domain-containing protein [Betaproteobacteria bacterium]
MQRMLIALVLFAAVPAMAMSPQELLEIYRKAAASTPGFAGFSAERGKAFYLKEVKGPNGEHSCSSCHSPDPTETVFGHSGSIRAECTACHISGIRAPGRPGSIRKDIKPLAPIANADRFTDPDKTELWFEVNCFYVLGRGCTAQEKGDLLTYLLSVGR